MILVRLNGGLGNQLFQYAAGKALAEHHGVELKLDMSFFDNDPLRVYELENFNISAEIASKKELNDLFPEDRSAVLRWAKTLVREVIPYYRRNVYREPYFHFDDNFFKAQKNVYLSGYWQSDKYFSNIATAIIKAFQIVSLPDAKNAELLKKIQNANSVSIHVRRGDYVNNPNVSRIHGLCSLDYYMDSIKLIFEKILSPQFFIFSDDIEWARSNLTIPLPATFVDINKEEKAYEDFRLMSHCKHHVIANSSFSWWCAWLSQNRDKIVIAPKKWFNTDKRDTKDLFPESWITR